MHRCHAHRTDGRALPNSLAVEETSNAMALDGIMFEGVSVRVRRYVGMVCVVVPPCVWVCDATPLSEV